MFPLEFIKCPIIVGDVSDVDDQRWLLPKHELGNLQLLRRAPAAVAEDQECEAAGARRAEAKRIGRREILIVDDNVIEVIRIRAEAGDVGLVLKIGRESGYGSSESRSDGRGDE